MKPNDHPFEMISAFLDGEIDAAGRSEVEEHLRDCASCRDLTNDLRRLDAAIAAEPAPPIPSGLAARIAWRLRGSDASGRKASLRLSKWTRIVAAGGSLAAALILAFVVVWERTSPINPVPVSGDARHSVSPGTSGVKGNQSTGEPGAPRSTNKELDRNEIEALRSLGYLSESRTPRSQTKAGDGGRPGTPDDRQFGGSDRARTPRTNEPSARDEAHASNPSPAASAPAWNADWAHSNQPQPDAPRKAKLKDSSSTVLAGGAIGGFREMADARGAKRSAVESAQEPSPGSPKPAGKEDQVPKAVPEAPKEEEIAEDNDKEHAGTEFAPSPPPQERNARGSSPKKEDARPSGHEEGATGARTREFGDDFKLHSTVHSPSEQQGGVSNDQGPPTAPAFLLRSYVFEMTGGKPRRLAPIVLRTPDASSLRREIADRAGVPIDTVLLRNASLAFGEKTAVSGSLVPPGLDAVAETALQPVSSFKAGSQSFTVWVGPPESSGEAAAGADTRHTLDTIRVRLCAAAGADQPRRVAEEKLAPRGALIVPVTLEGRSAILAFVVDLYPSGKRASELAARFDAEKTNLLTLPRFPFEESPPLSCE